MSYMTISQQINSHIEFLKSNSIEVDELKINAGFIRCKFRGQIGNRGEFCYKTTQSQLNNGMIGLATWCRCQGGEIKTFKTYGLPLTKDSKSNMFSENIEGYEQTDSASRRKSELFWEYSEHTGESDYLRRKGVGYYGIRFRNNEYGKVAVIPLRDIHGNLWSYQLLNSDGAKRVPKNVKIGGLFHILQAFVNGQPIGIAESYVVAATCYELTGIPSVTAISSSNLVQVALLLRSKYPNSRIIVLADNDRHLEENKGFKVANLLTERLGGNCDIALPDFEGYPPARDYTDWNDLVREKGWHTARNMLTSLIRS